MRGVVMYGPGDVRIEDREDPTIREPTDAIIRVTAAWVCGSDLWPWRGQDPSGWPIVMGHEYVGVVEQDICRSGIDPGRVFDLTLPLEQAADGYRAMDERRAIKVLLTV